MAYFNGIRGEGNMVRHSSLRKWKSWQGAIIPQSRNLRIGPKRNFRFQKNVKSHKLKWEQYVKLRHLFLTFFKIFAYNFL